MASGDDALFASVDQQAQEEAQRSSPLTPVHDKPARSYLIISPLVLQFPIHTHQMPICTSILRLHNTHPDHLVAYKVKTTAPKRYCVRPNVGLIHPDETIEIQVLLNYDREGTSDKLRDRFQVQSIVADGNDLTNFLRGLWSTTPDHVVAKQRIKCRFVTESHSTSTSPVVMRMTASLPSNAGSASATQVDGNNVTPMSSTSSPSLSSASLEQRLHDVAAERDALRAKVAQLERIVSKLQSPTAAAKGGRGGDADAQVDDDDDDDDASVHAQSSIWRQLMTHVVAALLAFLLAIVLSRT